MNRRIGWLCLAVVASTILLQPLLAPRDPMLQSLDESFHPPGDSHWLGTDQLGRDVLARLASGAWYSISVALVALIVSSLLGTAIGGAAGLSGGWTDRLLSALTDLLLAFPRIVILINLAAVYTFGSALSLGLLVGLTGWMGTSRMVRTEVQSLRKRTFVEAAHAAGAARTRVVRLHLVPHVARLVVERAGLRFAGVILMAASLDFLGIGAPLDHPTWGNLINEGREYLSTAPWIAMPAVAMLSLTTVGVALIGDTAHRDRRDADG